MKRNVQDSLSILYKVVIDTLYNKLNFVIGLDFFPSIGHNNSIVDA